jgi:hypothetical protein
MTQLTSIIASASVCVAAAAMAAIFSARTRAIFRAIFLNPTRGTLVVQAAHDKKVTVVDGKTDSATIKALITELTAIQAGRSSRSSASGSTSSAG